jgi:hypothetical protein
MIVFAWCPLFSTPPTPRELFDFGTTLAGVFLFVTVIIAALYFFAASRNG